jgi:FKBP-type peptidyl-prolyl cis-trans isomerase (trigger factor)
LIFGSDNFWVPSYRSWPHPPTELEQLAARLGISDEELRASLREQIQRRRRERSEVSETLERTLDKHVARVADDPEAPPVHHQQRI